jgi:Zn-dependent metalloprotease
MQHCCSIIPIDVIRRLSRDRTLPDETRSHFVRTASLDVELRKLRKQSGRVTTAALQIAPSLSISAAPAITVYDCRNSQITPGSPIATPGNSTDADAKQVFDTTNRVATFYSSVFGRNSIDNGAMTIMSSIHYGAHYTNALWIGSQMVYGDGDGQYFTDFCTEDDVVGHEITHGVTQHTLQLSYTGDAGGLNEGNSDVFGSMFRQWNANQDVDQADWLIGAGIMGSVARQRGYTCLRDMAQPDAAHCLTSQPTNYTQITPNMDPHYSSGVPNFAFYKMAKAIGGKSWETAGQIWYATLTGMPPMPTPSMKAFADFMRRCASQLNPGNNSVIQAVDQAWSAVGL